MNLKARKYEQEHKQAAQKNLSARVGLLEGKGIVPAAIQKDPIVRKFKAAIRACNRRLTALAAQEKLIAQKIEAKAAKQKAPEPAPAPEPKAAKPPKKEKKAKEKKAPATDAA